MQNKVKETISRNRMLTRGDRVILAVSGGADSVGMLHIFVQCAPTMKIEYRVVHINHGLRGQESERDAAFVKDMCRKYHVPCKVIKVDVQEFANKNKLSTEEAARYLRYQALESQADIWQEEADTNKIIKIAIAHNKEDNAETILMQLARGSGLRGVAGMRAVRGRIIRPLIDVSRKEIEEYLKKEDVPYITDSTNLSDDYTRNRIRHDILPRLAQEVNSAAVDNISRAGRFIGMADAYISNVAAGVYRDDAEGDASCMGIPLDILRKLDPIIRLYVLKLLIGSISGTMKNITATHIDDMDALISSTYGRKIDLPYRLECTKDSQMLYVSRKKDSPSDSEGGKKIALSQGKLIFRAFPYMKGARIPDGDYLKWFDYDKIEDLMDVRMRQSGDYIDITGVGNKSVKSYMADAKIPAEIREQVPVVAIGKHVMWIVGYRISEYYKVSPKTKMILEIRYEIDK